MGMQPATRLTLRQTLILLLVLILVFAPRIMAGYHDLRAAEVGLREGIPQAEIAARLASAASRIPWRADLWGLAGQAAGQAGQHELARGWFAEGAARDALSQADWLAYGDVLEAQGSTTSACRAWEESIARFGSSNEAVLRLARVSRQAGEYQQAIDRLLALLDASLGDSADVQLELGLLLAAVEPSQALPHLVQATRLDPTLDAGILDLRASLNMALLADDRAYQFLLAGRALGARGEWDLASLAFQNAVREKFDFGEAWAWLGEAEQQLGGSGDLYLQRALTFDPHSALVQGLHGLALQRQGRAAEALAAYQEAARIEPDIAGWQIALGGAWVQSGDLVEARGHYERAVALAPQEPAGWRALAAFSLAYQVDLVEMGLPAARRLLQLTPGDWSAFDLAGQILLEVGDPIGAEVLLFRALELDPTQAAVWLHLALVFLQGPEPGKAHSYLISACSFDPEGPYGWQAERLLEQYFP